MEGVTGRITTFEEMTDGMGKIGSGGTSIDRLVVMRRRLFIDGPERKNKQRGGEVDETGAEKNARTGKYRPVLFRHFFLLPRKAFAKVKNDGSPS